MSTNVSPDGLDQAGANQTENKEEAEAIIQNANSNPTENKEQTDKFQQARPVAAPNSTQTAINDMLTKLDLKGFLRPSEVYVINYRPLSYVISWALLFLIPSIFEYDDQRGQHSLFYIYLVLFCGHCIAVRFMIYKINRNQTARKQKRYYPKMPTQNPSCFIRYFYVLCGETNKLLSVEAKTNDEIQIAPIFGGVLLVIGALSCFVLFVLIAFKEKQSLWSLCPTMHDSQCLLLQKTQFITFCCWLSMSLIIASSLLLEESADCKRKKASKQMLVLSTFSEKRTVGKYMMNKEILIDTLVAKIDRSINLFIFNELSWKSLIPTLIVYFIICCSVLFGYHLISYIDYFKEASPGSRCVDIYGRCISVYFIMILLYTLHRIIVQYKYPLIIMQELSQPINCTQTMDLFAWWKLRRYYRRYQIHSFSLIFDSVVAGVLLIAIIGGAYFIFLSVILYNNRFQFLPDDYVLIIFISYLSIYTLLICEIAASTNRIQLSHHDMLAHELICVTMNYCNQIDIEQYRRIQNHVLEHSEPMSILGINMNSTTISILRG
eukprot:725519_1